MRAWIHRTFTSKSRKNVRVTKRFQPKSKGISTSLWLDVLEDRDMLSVDAVWNSVLGKLEITATAADQIVISADTSNPTLVQLNGSTTLPTGVGQLQTSLVKTLVIQGGTGANSISAVGVKAAQYTQLTTLEIRGGSGNDTIVGSAFADLIYGDAGNDSILPGEGNDTVYGGADNDTIAANDDADGAEGKGNDLLYGESGHDSVDGGEGNDTIWGGAGGDSLGGSWGNDSTVGGKGFDTLVNSSGNDTLVGSGDDVGTEENDPDLYVFGGNNLGDDVVDDRGYDSRWAYNWFQDNDTIDFSGFLTAITLDLGDVANWQTLDSGSRVRFIGTDPTDLSFTYVDGVQQKPSAGTGYIESVIGTRMSGGDTLIGSDRINLFYGLEGNDTMIGELNDDHYLYYVPGSGENARYGATNHGSDQIRELDPTVQYAEFSSDSVNFATWNDSISIDLASQAVQLVSGTSTSPTIKIEFVNVNMSNAVVSGSEALGVEEVYGTPQADTIYGNSRKNAITLIEGNDYANARGGDDTFFMHTSQSAVNIGNDTLIGGDGNDTYSYGAVTNNNYTTTIEETSTGGEEDMLYFGTPPNAGPVSLFAAYTGTVTLNLTTSGAQTVTSGSLSINFVNGSTIENVFGSAQNDHITGSAVSNAFFGGAGNDTLIGGGGTDFLLGDFGNNGVGYGNDSLDGGDGRDFLFGDIGADTLSGGADNDFLLSGTITSFDPMGTILTEWTNTSISASQARTNILAISNLFFQVPTVIPIPTGETYVFDNDANADSLTGGDGDDWFLYDIGEDTAVDILSNDLSNDIG